MLKQQDCFTTPNNYSSTVYNNFLHFKYSIACKLMSWHHNTLQLHSLTYSVAYNSYVLVLM